jgi:arsenite-transporting ATPase
VGKSTLACATAVRLAQEYPGREILLFSTDPAHSLTACLGEPVGPQPVRVLPGLTAMEINAAAEFQALKDQYRLELQKVLSSVFTQWDLPFDRRVLESLLDLSPPGLDEIMALTRVLEFLEAGSFHHFILDAAPTGHLLRFLELPDLVDQWLKSFFGVLLKYQLTFRLPELAQRLVRLSKDLKRLRTLWREPSRAAVYAVAILTEMAFQETKDLVAACGRFGVAVPVLFLNQATPASAHCRLCAAVHRREELLLGRFRQEFPGRHLTVIYRQREPRNLARLQELAQVLYCPLAQENRSGTLLDLPVLSG